jgi:hypothetical protein
MLRVQHETMWCLNLKIHSLKNKMSIFKQCVDNQLLDSISFILLKNGLLFNGNVN